MTVGVTDLREQRRRFWEEEASSISHALSLFFFLTIIYFQENLTEFHAQSSRYFFIFVSLISEVIKFMTGFIQHPSHVTALLAVLPLWDLLNFTMKIH